MTGRAAAVVVDANICLALVQGLPYSRSAERLVAVWRREGVMMRAPTLWAYECASALRKAVSAGTLPAARASMAMATLLALDVQLVPPTLELHDRALHWADRLGQVVAYDAAYIAVAEALDSDFWTADEHLCRASARCGADMVRWLGGATAS